MSAEMSADGANMVDNGGKRRRPEREGGQNKAASGEAAGVSAPHPQPGAESPLRSEDETSDGAMATNRHYPVPKIHRSKRQCVRERDLAWDSAQEGVTTGVAKQFVREGDDGKSAWTSSSPADEVHVGCPSTGNQEMQKNAALAWAHPPKLSNRAQAAEREARGAGGWQG